jgi:hypothetical protein
MGVAIAGYRFGASIGIGIGVALADGGILYPGICIFGVSICMFGGGICIAIGGCWGGNIIGEGIGCCGAIGVCRYPCEEGGMIPIGLG